MGSKKDIGQVLKSAMGDYKAAPDDLWPALETKLKRKKRIRVLLWLLLLLTIISIGTAIIYMTNSNKINKPKDIEITSKQNMKSTQQEQYKNKIMRPADSISNLSKQQNNIEKTKENPSNKVPQNQNTVKRIPNNDKSLSTLNSSYILKPETKNHSTIETIGIKKFRELKLTTDSIKVTSSLTFDSEVKTKSIWKLSPFVSLDHYNAFGRKTSKQNTVNYGVYLYFYGSENLNLRTGFKKLDLQYNFFDRDDASQQKVSYFEVPVEARYTFNPKKTLTTSVVAGLSFLYLQDATLINFQDNTTTENKDFFTRASFSLNTGFGLHYHVSSKWQFNAETLFKYQISPFSGTQDYSPFNISLGFGVEYKF